MKYRFARVFLVLLLNTMAGASLASGLGIGITVDNSRYVLGRDTLTLAVSAFNQDTDRQVDVHVAFLAPNGVLYELPDWNTGFRPWLSGFTLPGDFSLPSQTVANIDPVTQGMSTGSWSAVAAFTEPGTLNVLSLTTQPFSLVAEEAQNSGKVVDTHQTLCYDTLTQIICPQSGAAYYGQDAQHAGVQPSYTNNGNGTVTDHNSGLVWQQSPDLNGDGSVDAADKLTVSQAESYPATLNAQNFGGYGDWRLPTIKELYSLMDFRGTDPSSVTGTDTSGLTPFLDTAYFAFGYGDAGAGERIIDAQYVSATRYVGTTMGGAATVFGVNFADGRIKGYPTSNKTFYVRYVRGTSYGENLFIDKGDGTISDQRSGLLWSQQDSGSALNWEQALSWVAQKNAENYLGYSDWRLPNAKELQGIVDYSRSPETSGNAAIDPLFGVSVITNEGGQSDYPCYWSSTTHLSANGTATYAVYVAFGRALGYWNGSWTDVHGAGAQRSDPKSGNPAAYPTGHGPQGDAIRIYNHVRLVRGG